MNDDYLWSGSGEPDPDVARLEGILAPLRENGEPPKLPRRWRARPRLAWSLGLAAALMLVSVGAWLLLGRSETWEVVRLAGAPAVAGRPVTGTDRLAAGEWLETDAASRAKLRVGVIGSVDLEPGTRLRLVAARAIEHRIELQRGTIHALISAPPRFFKVDTPTAVAVDLGCAYSLHVADGGEALLEVTFGWVAFEHGSRTSYVPAGAACRVDPRSGPGAPFFLDASPAFREALAVVESSASGTGRAAALRTLAGEARARDGITLLTLLPRVPLEERAPLFDRLSALVPPPPGLVREDALAGAPQAIDLWWPALGLGEMKWWKVVKG